MYKRQILVRGNATDPGRENRSACLRGYPVNDELAGQEIVWYDTPLACLQAVERGEVDSFVTNSYLLQQYLQNRSSRNLVYSPLDDSSAGLCLALPRPADTTLLTVLSKAIGSISELSLIHIFFIFLLLSRVPCQQTFLYQTALFLISVYRFSKKSQYAHFFITFNYFMYTIYNLQRQLSLLSSLQRQLLE